MRFFIGVLSAFILVFASMMALSGCKQQNTQAPQNHVDATTGPYRISVHVPNPPLKTQEETYILTVEDAGSRQPIDTEALSAKVTMTMPDHAMEAPTTVKKLQPGSYELTTQFTMPGEWVLEVKPSTSAKAVSLKLPVDTNE